MGEYMSQAHEHDIAMRVNALINAVQELDDMAQDGNDFRLIQRDEEDLALAYSKLGRLLTRLRFPILQRSA